MKNHWQLFRYSSFLILYLLGNSSWAQSVLVNTIVPTNPPPITYSEILSFESDVIFQVTNLTSDQLQVKFGLTLTNERRGIRVAIAEEYLPSTPILLEANESKNFRFRNIKSAYDNLTENDILLEGITYERIVRAERLPEGDYELCMTVQDYFTNELLSIEGSCGYFPILEYEPPIIIYPDYNQTVSPTDPQSILFQWTPTGDFTKTRYRIQLVNASDHGFENPLDVFSHEDEVFIYERDGLRMTQFLYNQNHPMLVEGSTYSLRVQAYDNNQELNYLNDGWSQPVAFLYQSGTTGWGGPGDLTNDSGNDINTATINCVNYSETISTDLDAAIQVGQPILINAFEVATTQLQFDAGSQTYSGEGSINIPFLETNIDVAFSNIKINTDSRVYGEESIIYGQIDNSNILSIATSTNWETPADINFTNNFQSHISSKLAGIHNIKNLPFRMPQSDAVVVAFLLRPDQAKLKINLPLSLPEISGNSDPYISFTNKDICIGLEGFMQENMTLQLTEDINLPIINSSMRLLLPSENNEATIISNGEVSINIDGNIEFSKSIVAYKSGDNKVRIPFSKSNVSGLDFLVAVDTDVNNLIFPPLKDLRIAPEQIVVDLSSNNNASGFNSTFSGYTSLWKGVFIKAGNVKLPNGLGDNNLLIDIDGCALSANGLSLKVDQNQQVINLTNGRVASWPFAINGFELTVEEGEITNGELAGNLRLPIQDSGKISYTALLSANSNNQLDVALNVQPSEDIDVDMWLAKMDVYEASTISLQKIDGKYKIEADISGNLAVVYDGAEAIVQIGQVNIPSLDFQHLKVTGQQGAAPQLQVGAVALEDQDGVQLSLQTFNFTMEDWNIRTVGGRHALSFSLGMSLFGGDLLQGGFGAGVSTDLDIWAKYQNGFKFDEVKLKAIEGELDLGIAEATVKINLYDNDPTFGNGFRGEAGIKLKTISCAMEAGFVIQFGKVNGYRYWYFDGTYKNKAGIPIANSGVSLYGFGGGGYYNMQTVGPDEDEEKRYNELESGNPVSYTNPAQSISDFSYEPNNGTKGFRALAVIGSAATSRAWNLECNLLMEWESGFNIKNVVFEGTFNMMRAIDDDGDPPLKLLNSATSKLVINASRDPDNTRTFIAELETQLDGQFLSVSFPLAFMYRSLPNGNNKQWYIHLGSWSRADPFTDDSRITMRKGPDTEFFTMQMIFKAYLMMGNTYHKGSILPPLPDYITASKSDDFGNGPLSRNQDEAQQMQDRLNGSNESTFGIGLGLGLEFQFKLDVLIFYTNFKANVVTDFALTLPDQGCAGENSVGFNGWFAAGQAYAFVEGNVGVKGRLFGKNFRVNLVHLEAGAIFQVQFPSPKRIQGTIYVGGSILNGRIKFKTRRLELEKGEKCVPVGAFDPLSNLTYVNEVIPNNGQKKVDVFANPRIAFNIPNQEILTFQDIENSTHTYKVEYTIRLKNLKNNELVEITEKWSSDDQAFRMIPEAWLEGKTNYEITVYIKAFKKAGNTFTEVETKERKFTFKTKERPDFIPAEQIVQSYPGLGQRYFMVAKDNGDPIRGFLNLDKVICEEILREVNFDDPRDGYWAVFTNLRTRKESAIKCECVSSDRVEWDMPQHMAPEDIYRVELLARDFEGALAAPTQELEEEWVGTSYLQANGAPTVLYEQQTNSFTDKNTYTSHTKTKDLLDENIGWYAQRSKFNSYGEKLDRFSLHEVAYLPKTIGYNNPVTEGFQPAHITSDQISKTFHIPFLLLRPNAITEPFDQYDLIGYQSPIFGIGRIAPILNPTAEFNSYSTEYSFMRGDQLGTFEDDEAIDQLTNGAGYWPRPTRYPYYSAPNTTMGRLPRFLRNYKRYERLLSEAGYNVNLWRPARKVSWDEVSQLIDGHQSDASGFGFADGGDPTHGSGGDLPLQIYMPSGPISGASAFVSNEVDNDIDPRSGIGSFSSNNSYLPLVDWTSLILHKDRVHINEYAINAYLNIPSILNVNAFLTAVKELDHRFRTLSMPEDNYTIKLNYQTGGTYEINYQYQKP